jgi:hypothetical protein
MKQPPSISSVWLSVARVPCSIDNAEVELDHDERELRRRIAGVTARLAAGAALAAQNRRVKMLWSLELFGLWGEHERDLFGPSDPDVSATSASKKLWAWRGSSNTNVREIST